MNKIPENRLIIVSNRLPIVLTRGKKDQWQLKRGTGGLVTALAPVLRDRGGIWIGWPGTAAKHDVEMDKLLASATKDSGYTLKPVMLTAEDRSKYYRGFSNEVLWPLFHDLQSYCNFRPDYLFAYQRVNKKFAQVIAQNSRTDDFIWVHDYHLMGVAKALRDLGSNSRSGFFLHTPFPSLDIFLKLPWRFHILRALLEYDLIGFQTLRDRRNFVQCVRTLVKDTNIFGRGQVLTLRFGNRKLRVGAFPISIDFNEFAKLAKEKEVANRAWYIHEDLPHQKIILGVDRLDYTKGIPEKLKAFRNALSRFPNLQEKVVLIQVLVPSRRGIPKYRDLKTEIERLVGEINGQFTRSGWVPIHYIFRSLERKELLAYYRTAEIALLTPLKDGMNLVAKEYCASNLEENGVLILSEFAGATAQLQKSALLVNPHDIEGMAEAIYQAFRMPQEERRSRMKKLRQSIRKYNIFWWVNCFLQAAIAKRLDNFPVLADYVPIDEITDKIERV
ncbi:MAG: alpha,alpha-trehalose-phosphate synthase [candidate division Zixibacteria bacterium SM23_81]|nr:MAG: alpha,alpha-trehalose-phosphate synthase [candidate division Zixibacteria bacterium SM23_81]